MPAAWSGATDPGRGGSGEATVRGGDAHRLEPLGISRSRQGDYPTHVINCRARELLVATWRTAPFSTAPPSKRCAAATAASSSPVTLLFLRWYLAYVITATVASDLWLPLLSARSLNIALLAALGQYSGPSSLGVCPSCTSVVGSPRRVAASSPLWRKWGSLSSSPRSLPWRLVSLLSIRRGHTRPRCLAATQPWPHHGTESTMRRGRCSSGAVGVRAIALSLLAQEMNVAFSLARPSPSPPRPTCRCCSTRSSADSSRPVEPVRSATEA